MGMRLSYSGPQRSLATQRVLYECYLAKKNTGTCPEGCYNNCPLAGRPECVDNSHNSGEAVDVFWYPKEPSNAPYFDLTKISALEECNGGACCGEINTAADPDSPYPCTADEKDDVAISQKALQTVMISAGASRHICPEYWHFDVSGLRGCDPGVYSSPKIGTIYDTSKTVITLPQ
jgi:D-alanyl-D-alanine dipeptidase